MRRTALAFASALLLLLCARSAAAQLEMAGAPSTGAPRAFEPSMAVHAGLRVNYAALATAEGPLDDTVVGGLAFGITLQHESWRILDFRLHLLSFGAEWSEGQDPDFVSQFGLQLGTGLRARAGIVSFAATALVGLGAWLGSNPVSFDAGGELAIAFHASCEAFELGYQALATATTSGFAEVPSHGVVFRWLVTNGGPEWETCRDEHR